MRPLYDHQTAAMDLLRQSLARGKRRPMLQAPTGFGKTLLAAAIVDSALRKGNRVVFTVPSISLIDQTVAAFGSEGIEEIGVVQADHPLTDYRKPVQIASVQTLARRAFPGTDLVLVDEAHQAHRVLFDWMEQQPDLRFVGLSATPWARGLGRHYDDLLIAATTKDLIARGYLSPFRVFAPSHPDLAGVHTVAGDYHEGELAEAMNKPQLVADVVRTWLEHGENRPTFCFAVNRAHAHSLEDQFRQAGVTTAYIDAFTDRAERAEIGADFNAGRVRVVVNVGCLTTGVDWDVRCIILARPTKSEMLFVQIIGRGLRRAEGKTDCLVLDHSDSTLRLGFPDDIHHSALDDGKPRTSSNATRDKAPALPRECASCHALKPAGVHVCPECGFAPAKREDVAVVDGNLVQISGAKVKADRMTKQRFWSGLLWYCEQRGYGQGWAGHKFREKFGVWPRGLSDRAQQPDTECRNFVKAGQIRFAKAQEKANGQRVA